MAYDDLDRPPLDAQALAAALVGPGTWWREVRVSDVTASTNADLEAAARADAPEGTAVTTDHQAAGRGRLDRGWSTPARSSVALSMLVRPDTVPVERWPWLPLLAGVAVVETVRRDLGVDADLKWPNDVLVGDRKLAGILVGRVETPTGPSAVVGVGLNVTQRRDELPTGSATSLALEGAATHDRAVVVRALMRTFEALYRGWAAAEGDPAAGLHASYARRCATLDRPVDVSLPDGGTLHGTAEAIDAAGRLVVAAGDGTRRALSAGDVVHVRARPARRD